ncbi:MAG: Ig-like domain-containing protein [Limisphaerales bacterium]
MNGRRLSILAATAGLLVGVPAVTAAPAVAHSVLDAGGGRSSTSRFVLDASLGVPGGTAAGPGTATRAGYAGQLNEPPRLGADSFAALRLGQALKIPPAALLANDDDAEGDPIALAGVVSPSLVGAALEVIEGWAFYRPAPLPLPADEFTYLADDGVGGLAAAVVTLLDGAADPGVTSNRVGLPVFLPGGALRVTFAGIPGRLYAIEVADDLTPPAAWQVLACGPAAANGLLSADDPAPVGGVRIYRAVEVPDCQP